MANNDSINILIRAILEKTTKEQFEKELRKIQDKLPALQIKSGLDKVTKDFKALADGSKDLLKVTTDTTNSLGQQVKTIEKVDKETKELVVDSQKVTDNYKKQRAEAEKIAKEAEKATKKAEELKEKQLQYEQKVRVAIEKNIAKEKIKTTELEKQIILFQREFALRTQNITGKYGALVNTTALGSLTKDVQSLSTSTPDITNKMRHMSVGLSEIESNARNSGKALKLAQQDARSFSNELIRSASKFALWIGIGTTIMQTINFVRTGIDTIYQLDTAITDLKKVSDEIGNSVGVREFLIDVNKLAIEVGHSTKAAIDSITDFKRLGYTLSESQKLAEQALIYSNISDQSIEDSTQSIISTLKGFQLGVNDVIHVMDSYNEVGNKFSITSAGIGHSLQRSSSALYEANNTLEESIGLIVAANASIQNPEKVGNGLKTVAMRIRGVSEETGEAIPSLRELIKDITDVDIMLNETTFKSTYQIMTEISKVWKSIEDADQALLLEKLFGKHQGAVGASLLNNMTDGIKAADTAINSFGSSAREQSRYMESLAAKVNTLRESVVKLWTHALDAEWLKALVSFGTGIVNIVDKIGLLQTVLGGVIIYFSAFRTSLLLAPIINAATVAISGLTAGLNLSTAAAIRLNTVLGMFAPLAIAAGIFGLIKAYDALNVSITEHNQNVNESYNEAQKNVESIRNLKIEYEGLAKQTDLSKEQRLRLIEIERELKTKYGETASAIDLQSKSLAENSRIMDEVARKEAERFRTLNQRAYNDAKKLLDPTQKYKVGMLPFNNIDEAERFYQEKANDSVDSIGLIHNTYLNALKDIYKDKDAANDIISKFEGYQDLLNIPSATVLVDDDRDGISDYSGSSSDKTPIPYEDMSRELINSFNELSEIDKLENTLLDKQIKRAEKAKEYNQAIQLTGDLLLNQKKTVTDLESANQKILDAQKAITDRVKYDTKSWFDVNSEATLSYKELLNTFAGKTDTASKNAKKNIEDIFSSLYSLKQAWKDNTNEIDLMNEAIESSTDKISQLQESIIDTSLKSITTSISSEIKDLRDELDSITESYENDIQSIEERYDKRIESREEELDLTRKQNEEEEKLLAIQEAQQRLNELKGQRTQRVFVKGIGWVWSEDTQAISEAQSELDDLQRGYDEWKRENDLQEEIDDLKDTKDKKIKILRDELKGIKDNFDDRIEDYESFNDELQKMQDMELSELKLNFSSIIKELKSFKDQWNQYGSQINNISANINTGSGGGSGGGSSSGGSSSNGHSDYYNEIVNSAPDQATADARADYLDSIGIHHKGLKAGLVGGKIPSGEEEVIIKALKGELLLNKQDLLKVPYNILNTFMPKLPQFTPAFAGMPNSNGVTIQNLVVNAPNGATLEGILADAKRLAKFK
jgi:TP901 family phage tail tape measure protein